ncbi:MAG: alpha/beta-type small acid-soluble spore protein [Clostridia bacterium]|nr:alpha/beta-type small acid-soluble spore protein [Clostridia bacterium]
MATKKNNNNESSNKSNLENLKAEVASSLNINLSSGENGELTSREAGSIGGEMVKRMIEYAEKNIK